LKTVVIIDKSGSRVRQCGAEARGHLPRPTGQLDEDRASSGMLAGDRDARPRFNLADSDGYSCTMVDGDLVSLDFAAEVDGWVADSSITIPVGTPRDEDLRQIETAERALAAGIAAAQPGNRLGDVSAAVGGRDRARQGCILGSCVGSAYMRGHPRSMASGRSS
jgi:methionine aminopeptidase